MECDITNCEYMQLASEKIEKYESEILKIQNLFLEIDKMHEKKIIESIKINTIIDFSREIRKRVFELSKI
jgi:hypothetical protein